MQRLERLAVAAVLAVAFGGTVHADVPEPHCGTPDGHAACAPARHETQRTHPLRLLSEARAMTRQETRDVQLLPSMPEPPRWTLPLSALLIVAFIARRRANWPVD